PRNSRREPKRWRAKSAAMTNEFSARLEAEMAYHRRRHVDEYALPSDLIRANVVADDAPDAIETPALAAVGEWRFQLADEDVLIVGQGPARLQETVVNAVNLAYLSHRKVVERQTGNDEII